MRELMEKERVFAEKRPTCVSVIGWVWIVLGSLMCLSVVMLILIWTTIARTPQKNENTDTFLVVFPILVVIQVVLSALSITSGIYFLKLRAWARTVLEVLTWLALIYVVGFMIVWICVWISAGWGGGMGAMGVVMGVAMTAFYGIPLGIMLKFLREEKVKNAVK